MVKLTLNTFPEISHMCRKVHKSQVSSSLNLQKELHPGQDKGHTDNPNLPVARTHHWPLPKVTSFLTSTTMMALLLNTKTRT